MSCYVKSDNKWVGSDITNADECVQNGGRWVESPSTLNVSDASVCNKVALSTFFNCATRSFQDTFADFRDWSKGSGTFVSEPPNPALDTNPDDTLKRVQNIFTTNKRYVYIGVYVALFVALVVMLIRIIT
jgi:hypothetical protein